MTNLISIKVKLEEIMYDHIDYGPILNAINNMHSYTSVGSLFIRSFILYCIEFDKQLPPIDKNFIRIAFSVIGNNGSKKGRGFNSELQDTIKNIQDYYLIFKKKVKSNKLDDISNTNLSYLLGQEYEQIYISIINNIKYNFEKHFWQFLKSQFNNVYINTNTPEQKKIYYNELEMIKNDILNNTYCS